MEAAEKKMGDPSDAKTVYGPLADKKQFDRVMSFLDGAREEGIQVLVGGERQGTKGAFVKPTVFLTPDLKSKVYTDEIFGPVISVRTFKDEEEAIKLANDTTYGLGCKSSITTSLNYEEMRANVLQQPSTPQTSPGPFEWLAKSKLALLASTLLSIPRLKLHSVATSRAVSVGRVVQRVLRRMCNLRQSTST
jgi:hypothetical protein